jgi:exodeoxyribonuclease V beta subunit
VSLARHCQRHYDVQTRLYTLATLRMFGIGGAADYDGRFGGVLFCFLRGRREGEERSGLLFLKPTWQDILAWEREMLGSTFWGLAR